ncbi:MAG: hypothetical protein KDC38_18565 [Planctomycetes bacterium]|nr:hypothetical protein [Planctomycetota bacterium]
MRDLIDALFRDFNTVIILVFLALPLLRVLVTVLGKIATRLRRAAEAQAAAPWESVDPPETRIEEPTRPVVVAGQPGSAGRSAPVTAPRPAPQPIESMSDLRDLLAKMAGAPATKQPPTPPPPPPRSREAKSSERKRGAELVHTKSTSAYDVSTDAYRIADDAYRIADDAYAVGRRRHRRHRLVGATRRRDLRRALIWRELLAPPIGLRDRAGDS